MTTTTTTGAKLLTAADLLRLYGEGVRGELIRGVLCETMATGIEHGRIVTNLVIELGTFVRSAALGTLVASDSGVWLERDPDTVREPDIAFFSAERMPLHWDPEREKYVGEALAQAADGDGGVVLAVSPVAPATLERARYRVWAIDAVLGPPSLPGPG